MTSPLQRLGNRALGLANRVEPRIASRFEPQQPNGLTATYDATPSNFEEVMQDAPVPYRNPPSQHRPSTADTTISDLTALSKAPAAPSTDNKIHTSVVQNKRTLFNDPETTEKHHNKEPQARQTTNNLLNQPDDTRCPPQATLTSQSKQQPVGTTPQSPHFTAKATSAPDTAHAQQHNSDENPANPEPQPDVTKEIRRLQQTLDRFRSDTNKTASESPSALRHETPGVSSPVIPTPVPATARQENLLPAHASPQPVKIHIGTIIVRANQPQKSGPRSPTTDHRQTRMADLQSFLARRTAGLP